MDALDNIFYSYTYLCIYYNAEELLWKPPKILANPYYILKADFSPEIERG